MKTTIIDEVISEKELFYIYKQLVATPNWLLNGRSSTENEFNSGPLLPVKKTDGTIINYSFCLWGQSIIFRIAKLLQEKNIGIPTELSRMWFNTTYHGKKTQHWFHPDIIDDSENFKSILIFMTPIWQPDWRGSFYIDGEEFKFKPGSAIIFDSKEYHKGESPISETYNWQRITCNIVVKD